MAGFNRNNSTDNKQHYEHVDSIAEVANYQGGNHFLAAGLVVQSTGKPAYQNSDGQGNKHAQAKTTKAANVKIADENDSQLAGYSAYYNTEVKAQTGNYRDDKGQYQEGIAIDTVAKLGKEPVEGNTFCKGKAHQNEYPEDNGYDIIQNKFLKVELAFIILLYHIRH